MRRPYNPEVTIRRQRRHEAEQAISDLEKRGYVISFPLTEQTRDGKRFTTDYYSRRIFQENTFGSCWIAKLKKVD